MNDQGRQSDSRRAALRDAATRIVRGAPRVVALAGAIVLVAVQVPLLEPVLEKLGLTGNQDLYAVVITLLLTTLLIEMQDLSGLVTRDLQGPRHLDTDAMYELLKARADEIKKQEDRHIDVIGLTLFSAWIHLRFWLYRDGCTDWTIRFTTLAENTTRTFGLVPEDWPSESAGNRDEIRQYADRQSTKSRRHKLKVIEYDFVPGVHGFRLGNGDVFVGSVRWEENGRLSKDFTYEFIPGNDDSYRANAHRELFDNWFTRAASGGTVSP